MKFLLITLLAIKTSLVFSQEMQFTVSANNESITVSPGPGNDNTGKLLVIDKTLQGGNDFLTIRVTNEEMEKDWKRNFSIYDSSDNAIKDLVLMKDGTYCARLSELTTQLEPAQDYFIYTTAIPKDPKKAMQVRVARMLVCRIRTR